MICARADKNPLAMLADEKRAHAHAFLQTTNGDSELMKVRAFSAVNGRCLKNTQFRNGSEFWEAVPMEIAQ